MKNRIVPALLSIALLTGAANAIAQGPGGGHRPPRFEELDADSSGTLTSDEFVAVALERFDALDSDADGSISSDEFTAPALEHFTKADADGDGLVTEAELQAARPRRGRGPQAESGAAQ